MQIFTFPKAPGNHDLFNWQFCHAELSSTVVGINDLRISLRSAFLAYSCLHSPIAIYNSSQVLLAPLWVPQLLIKHYPDQQREPTQFCMCCLIHKSLSLICKRRWNGHFFLWLRRKIILILTIQLLPSLNILGPKLENIWWRNPHLTLLKTLQKCLLFITIFCCGCWWWSIFQRSKTWKAMR